MHQEERVGLTAAPALPSVVVQAFWIVLFALGTAAGARLEIPHTPVPYTLQTMVVLLAGAFLGARNGFLSQCAYLALGAAGAPVFAGGAAGWAVLAGPTGGYLAGFPFAAAAVGALAGGRHSLPRIALAMAAGLLLIFALGAAQLALVTTHSVSTALGAGVLIFSWWDALKLGAASMIYFEAGKRWRRLPR